MATKKKPAKVKKKAPKKTAAKKTAAKKTAAKKTAAKKTAAKKTAARKRAPANKKPTPVTKKRKGSPRRPPMHTQVNHPELDDEEHEEVFEIFRVYDRDGSGSIDRQEFARLLEALGSAPSEDELAVALDVVDANHSGKISWDEFKAWWTNR